MLAMSDDRPASVADIVVEELRKKEINGPIRLPKRDFFTRGQKLKVKDPWHILSGYDLEFAGMSTRERVRVMLEWFGRRQTIALPINSVVGCLIATILLMISSENNVGTPWRNPVSPFFRFPDLQLPAPRRIRTRSPRLNSFLTRLSRP